MFCKRTIFAGMRMRGGFYMSRPRGPWFHNPSMVMKRFRCNFVSFFLHASLKVCNGTGSSLSHFAFQNAPHILYWGQVRTAGRPVQHPHTLLPQPCLWNVCRMVLHCLVEICMGCRLEGSICCSKISMYFSAFMGPSQKCNLPLPRALTHPHTMTDPGFWTCW